MRKALYLIIIFILPFSFCYPETIKLKSGRTIEAKIIEKTDKYIKVDFYGVSLTFYFEDVESIDGVPLGKEK